ncbi:MAG TPA: TIGR01777 family oxidoreductase [Candidatus Solibacter sp.]|nr:TIGR01777 family oxidoreductase [Candidatus Solibacter sp.]
MVNVHMARVLVSGASGLVGSALVPAFRSAGAHVVRLTRPGAAAGNGGDERIPWDPSRPLAPEAVSGFDAVVHLAGESIVGRWTEAKKARIRESRIPATTNLAKALAAAKDRPAVFLSASAIGYYGNRADEVLTEEAAPGTGFAADLAREWEAATTAAAQAGIRTVQIRTGIVLATNGGALPKMLPAFKLGVGGKVGSGQQWMSWVDLQDVVGAIHHLLRSDLVNGPVNVVAPRPVTNAEFTKILAGVLSRPAIFPMPAFAARLAFGQMADELLLASQRVEPMRLIESGYPFRFGELRASLEHHLKK